MLLLVTITMMTWQARHKLAKPRLQMMLLLSSGFLVVVFIRKAKSSFIWWWSSFWSWLMCRAATVGCTSPTEVPSSEWDCDQQQETINYWTLLETLNSKYSFPRQDLVNDGLSTLECGIGLAPQALVCCTDPPLQNCICVVLQWVPMLACKFESESHIDQCKL